MRFFCVLILIQNSDINIDCSSLQQDREGAKERARVIAGLGKRTGRQGRVVHTDMRGQQQAAHEYEDGQPPKAQERPC